MFIIWFKVPTVLVLRGLAVQTCLPKVWSVSTVLVFDKYQSVKIAIVGRGATVNLLTSDNLGRRRIQILNAESIEFVIFSTATRARHGPEHQGWRAPDRQRHWVIRRTCPEGSSGCTGLVRPKRWTHSCMCICIHAWRISEVPKYVSNNFSHGEERDASQHCRHEATLILESKCTDRCHTLMAHGSIESRGRRVSYIMLHICYACRRFDSGNTCHHACLDSLPDFGPGHDSCICR